MASACDLAEVARLVERRRSAGPSAVLVGLSGIDGAGKGFLAAELRRELERSALRVALINVDGWLNLPAVRFSPDDPAEHFYRHALRLDELFSDLVLPLRLRRTHRLVAPCRGDRHRLLRPPVRFSRGRCRPAGGDFHLQAGLPIVLRPGPMDRLQLRDRARASAAKGPGGLAACGDDCRLREDLLPGPADPLAER
jgi:hypothetical protein